MEHMTEIKAGEGEKKSLWTDHTQMYDFICLHVSSSSFLSVCLSSWSFMFTSEECATYHRGPERLSYKSWYYMADLTGQAHKDISISVPPSVPYPLVPVPFSNTEVMSLTHGARPLLCTVCTHTYCILTCLCSCTPTMGLVGWALNSFNLKDHH